MPIADLVFTSQAGHRHKLWLPYFLRFCSQESGLKASLAEVKQLKEQEVLSHLLPHPGRNKDRRPEERRPEAEEGAV